MKILFTIIALLTSVSLAGAEMYKWVAGDGSITYKDTPPPASEKRKKVKVYSDSDFVPAPPLHSASAGRNDKVAAAAAASAPAKKERFSGTVEIYVTEWCGYCDKAQEYMTSRGIPFVAYDIEKDSSAKQRHKELGGRGVPLIIIGQNRMSGFSVKTLEYYLKNTR